MIYTKFLAGAIALALVVGFTTPAFAQEFRPVANTLQQEFPPVCPSECADLALEKVYEVDPFCLEVEFDDICQEELELFTADCLATASANLCVAGELLPLDSTALLIGGLTSMSAWMIPAVAGLAGAGIYLVKFRANRD